MRNDNELNELTLHAARSFKIQTTGASQTEDDFIEGAEWERERTKWFDAKMVLPPVKSRPDLNVSDLVFVEFESGIYSADRYDYRVNRWYNYDNEDTPIKRWTYIPK